MKESMTAHKKEQNRKQEEKSGAKRKRKGARTKESWRGHRTLSTTAFLLLLIRPPSLHWMNAKLMFNIYSTTIRKFNMKIVVLLLHFSSFFSSLLSCSLVSILLSGSYYFHEMRMWEAMIYPHTTWEQNYVHSAVNGRKYLWAFHSFISTIWSILINSPFSSHSTMLPFIPWAITRLNSLNNT